MKIRKTLIGGAVAVAIAVTGLTSGAAPTGAAPRTQVSLVGMDVKSIQLGTARAKGKTYVTAAVQVLDQYNIGAGLVNVTGVYRRGTVELSRSAANTDDSGYVSFRSNPLKLPRGTVITFCAFDLFDPRVNDVYYWDVTIFPRDRNEDCQDITL